MEKKIAAMHWWCWGLLEIKPFIWSDLCYTVVAGSARFRRLNEHSVYQREVPRFIGFPERARTRGGSWVDRNWRNTCHDGGRGKGGLAPKSQTCSCSAVSHLVIRSIPQNSAPMTESTSYGICLILPDIDNFLYPVNDRAIEPFRIKNLFRNKSNVST
jgi:hypothetical protein